MTTIPIKNTLIPDWFDIKKYENQNSLSNYEFAFNLYLRFLIIFESFEENNHKSNFLSSRLQAIKDFGLVSDNQVDDFVMSEFIDQWLSVSRLGWSNTVGLGVVSRLPIARAYDIYQAVQDDTQLRNMVARYEYKMQVAKSEYPFDEQDLNEWNVWYDQYFLMGSIEELDTSLGKDERFVDVVSVDLNAPDEILFQGFKDWLKNTRTTKFIDSNEESQLEKHDLSTLDKIKARLIKASVLPYIDLRICSRIEGKIIPMHAIGNAIFPEKFDTDVTESVRKTTKPLARLSLKMAIRYLRFEVIAQIESDSGIK